MIAKKVQAVEAGIQLSRLLIDFVLSSHWRKLFQSKSRAKGPEDDGNTEPCGADWTHPSDEEKDHNALDLEDEKFEERKDVTVLKEAVANSCAELMPKGNKEEKSEIESAESAEDTSSSTQCTKMNENDASDLDNEVREWINCCYCS